jgi:acetyl-CoA carboxylase biotin carboxylase subunit
MFTRMLIANRGEIAVRILRACQEMGIGVVAIYSEADAGALHVSLADEAVLVGAPPPRESYLHGERIIAAALERGCDALHPGYGFLSENADFAQAVITAGLTWVGPSPASMRAVGSKTAARRVAQAVGVPVVPGYEAGDSAADWAAAGQSLGYPLLVKASAGGGGKGMRRVESAAELPAALDSARREAFNAFGDDRIYLEKWLSGPRHVEFQVLGDHYGQLVHLFERECSVQRRHQKIVEETPSPFLDDELRSRMGQAAVAIAQAAAYSNAGTAEFLVTEDRDFYFLEMNTRLQVEHPITELVTGVDLVKAQIRIAAGERLPFAQEDLMQRGHAIECRIYAEDPANGFLPSTGKVLLAVEPVGPGVRVDAGVTTGDEVTLHYDPMIAKLIVLGQDRADALGRMQWALRHYVLLGEVASNIPFLREIVAHPVFGAGAQSTSWIEEEFDPWLPPFAAVADEVFVAAAFSRLWAGESTRVVTGAAGSVDPWNPWLRRDGFRIGRGESEE